MLRIYCALHPTNDLTTPVTATPSTSKSTPQSNEADDHPQPTVTSGHTARTPPHNSSGRNQIPPLRSAAKKSQRKKWRHAVTRRPLSPIHLAPAPVSPARLDPASTTLDDAPATPGSHPPHRRGGSGGAEAVSPKRGDRPHARGERRGTTTTNPTDIGTIRILDRAFAEQSISPTRPTSSADVYTRQHTHPG